MKVVCPRCQSLSSLGADLKVCGHCGMKLRDSTGMFDFVTSPDRVEERNFYDDSYLGSVKNSADEQSIESLWERWNAPEAPENRIVLREVGNLAGKNVLLLGNGESSKELVFLTMNPKQLVYSDLSTHALVNMEARFSLEQYRESLIFAAIDAHSIPFAPESFDLIYGFAMVHHLPDLDLFFRSVITALKPGGRAVFMDDAFAPLWHYSKQTWLRPVMRYSHKKSGISPEDYRFSMQGGFKEKELAKKILEVKAEPYFVRTSLLTYVLYRGAGKLLPRGLNKMLRRPGVSRTIRWVDTALCKLPVLRSNQIRLVWGFRKS